MKTRLDGLLSILCIFLCSIFLLTSCENVVLEEETTESEKNQTSLKIKTRAKDGTSLIYPLHVYAFTEKGQLHSQVQVSDSTQVVGLTLAKGMTYRLVVVSADADEVSIPANPTPNSVIALSSKYDGNVVAHPLMMGFADVRTTDANVVSCNISLQHQMTSLNISLQNVPDDCTDLSVTVASPIKGVALGGTEVDESTTVNVPLTSSVQDGVNVWSSGLVYLFPTAGSRTTFTINYLRQGEMQCSSVTYQATLHAGTPYIINGTYSDDESFRLNANVVEQGWEDPVYLSFDFADGNNSTIGNGSDNGDDNGKGDETDAEIVTYEVSEMLYAYDIWKEHIVAAVLDSSENEATLLLISRKDWDGMSSALSTMPNQAEDAAREYVEYDMKGWTIPTSEEAKVLYESYNQYATITSTETLLEEALSKVSADPIVLVEKGKTTRYLCEEAEKTYSYSVNSILTAGTSKKDYHLRLVKKIRIIVK